MSTRAKIVSRVICHEVALTAEQEQVAGRILRQAVVTLRKSHLVAERRAGDALQRALLGGPLSRSDRDLTLAKRVVRSPRQPWARDLRGLRREAQADTVYLRHPGGPSRRWLTVQRAAEITGYCEDHIRYVLRENPGIARRHWSGRLLVNRKDIQAYRRRMKKRGYGPHS